MKKIAALVWAELGYTADTQNQNSFYHNCRSTIGRKSLTFLKEIVLTIFLFLNKYCKFLKPINQWLL